jgi:hypothetical protein
MRMPRRPTWILVLGAVDGADDVVQSRVTGCRAHLDRPTARPAFTAEGHLNATAPDAAAQRARGDVLASLRPSARRHPR